MRLLQLRLIAFGPFVDREIDLAPGRGVHVIHGPNEAGKSTALRAIQDLFFGIPETTPDAHRHAMNELRIGALLADAEGRELAVVRRKGRKNTLLDASGKPMDDAALVRMLGGASLALFKGMFGLDHVRLREGADALLDDRGDVGQSLFDASLGGRGVQRVIAELEREADDLFKPRATNPTINKLVRAYEDARKELRDRRLRPRVWLEQTAALDGATRELDRLEAERRALFAEQTQLTRVQRARSVVVRRAERTAELQSLADAPDLPEGFTARRQSAEREIDDATRELARIERERADLEAERVGLDVPVDLASLDPARMKALRERLASHKKAELDLPKLRGAVAETEHEARVVLGRLGRPGDLAAIPGLVVDTAMQARLRRLAADQRRIAEALDGAEARLETLRARRDAAVTRAAALPALRDSAALDLAVSAALPLGDIEQRIASAQGRVERSARSAAALLDALGLWSGSLDALVRLAVPGVETVDRFDRDIDAAAREEERIEERRRDAEQRRDVAVGRIAALESTGEVPTVAELAEARRLRDEIWTSGRHAKAPTRDWASRFEAAERRADGVADRLWQQARRVEQLAQLEAERAAAAQEIERLETALGRAAAARVQVTDAWAAAWAPSGVAPLSPKEMRGWLARRDQLVALAGQIDAERAVAQQDIRVRDAARAALAAALGDAPDTPGALAALLARARAELAAREAALRAHQEAGRALADLDADLEIATREAARRGREHEAWQADWAASTIAIGLSVAATPEEVESVLVERAALASAAERIADHQRRIDSMERDARALAEELGALVGAHAPELSPLPLAEAGDRFFERYDAARRAREIRDSVEERLQRLARGATEHAAARDLAERRLAELLRIAGAVDRAALQVAEQRSNRRAELTRELREIADQLQDLGDGLGVEQLAKEVDATDATSARVRLADIERELEELGERIRGQAQDVGEKRAGLSTLGDEAVAADAALAMESASARIKDAVDTYVRTRLAVHVLRRQVERYREENQGPVLKAAGTLFPRLTLDAYKGLSVEFDDGDRPVLRAVRADGAQVPVEGLSDGTRDQLYLALRLASIDRFAAVSEPLPLILDDVLVHFDDERSRAALAALGEISSRVQVLFFTHHARLVELARDAVPADRLVVHELDRAASVAGAVAG